MGAATSVELFGLSGTRLVSSLEMEIGPPLLMNEAYCTVAGTVMSIAEIDRKIYKIYDSRFKF